MTTAAYVFKLKSVDRVVDGDTVLLQLSVGFHLTATEHIRVLGVDCPEMSHGSPFERREARRALQFTTDWFARPGVYWARTEQTDDFGRWLGEVWREGAPTVGGDWLTEPNLARALVGANLGTTWPRRWHEVFDPERNRP